MDPSLNHLVSTPTSSGGGGRQHNYKTGSSFDDNNNSGIQDEQVLTLVFRSINFDPHVVSIAACVSRRLRAVAKRVLWRELCISRAPRMVTDISCGGPVARCSSIGGGWHALAKLLFFCCGSAGQAPGHFVKVSRFSKTSGKSFLHKKCRGDLLYVSDPCEHPVEGEEDDLGVYRGVFRGFMRSKTRACLIGKQVQLESRVRCPYCGARVWSMTAAKMVPKSASRRLGSSEESLEYYVCVNGHLHGSCWLAHLSDDDGGGGGGDGDEDGEECSDEDEDEDDGRIAF